LIEEKMKTKQKGHRMIDEIRGMLDSPRGVLLLVGLLVNAVVIFLGIVGAPSMGGTK
jgi:hypothetical protein